MLQPRGLIGQAGKDWARVDPDPSAAAGPGRHHAGGRAPTGRQSTISVSISKMSPAQFSMGYVAAHDHRTSAYGKAEITGQGSALFVVSFIYFLDCGEYGVDTSFGTLNPALTSTADLPSREVPMDVELVLVSWETAKNDAPLARWSQLLAGTRDLKFFCEEIDKCFDEADIGLSLDRLHYQIISFLHLVYWLRERGVWLVAGICNDDALADRLKSGRTRQAALEQIAQRFPKVGQSLSAFLEILKSDTHSRNIHTHESFVTFQVLLNGDVYEPMDVYLDLADEPEKQARFVSALIEAAGKLIQHYRDKSERIDAVAALLLDSTDEILHPQIA